MPQKPVSFIFILFYCTFNSFPVADYKAACRSGQRVGLANPTVPGSGHLLAEFSRATERSKLRAVVYAVTHR